MSEEKEMTVHGPSVGADVEQSNQLKSNYSINEDDPEFNSFCDIDEENWEREMFLRTRPGYLKTISMKQLYDTVFETKEEPVKGLLCRGTYLFVGAPKVGKSFLMLQLAYHVSRGLPLWGYPVRKQTVLYFSLEDEYDRLQKRLYAMFGEEDTGDLHFATACKTVSGGLEDQIKSFVQEHPRTGLVIIDTLKRVRESSGTDYSYGSDYDLVAKLKGIADSCQLTMLIVHHTRKQKAEDIFEMISGTNGLMGAADGAFLLSKEKRTSNEATLDIVGRDQQDQRIRLKRNEETLAWEFTGAETELWKEPPDPLLERIAQALPVDGSAWAGTASELCEQLGLDMKPNTLSLKLNIGAGRLLQEYGVRCKRGRSHEGRRILLWKEESSGA